MKMRNLRSFGAVLVAGAMWSGVAAAERLPLDVTLKDTDHFGTLWTGDAATFLGTKLILAGEAACLDVGQKLQSLEQVTVKITASVSDALEDGNAPNSPKLLLSAPTGKAWAFAICRP